MIDDDDSLDFTKIVKTITFDENRKYFFRFDFLSQISNNSIISLNIFFSVSIASTTKRHVMIRFNVRPQLNLTRLTVAHFIVSRSKWIAFVCAALAMQLLWVRARVYVCEWLYDLHKKTNESSNNFWLGLLTDYARLQSFDDRTHVSPHNFNWFCIQLHTIISSWGAFVLCLYNICRHLTHSCERFNVGFVWKCERSRRSSTQSVSVCECNSYVCHYHTQQSLSCASLILCVAQTNVASYRHRQRKKKIAHTYSTGGREAEYIAFCLSVHRNHMWGKRNAHIGWVNCGVRRWWSATIVWIVPNDSIVSDVI